MIATGSGYYNITRHEHRKSSKLARLQFSEAVRIVVATRRVVSSCFVCSATHGIYSPSKETPLRLERKKACATHTPAFLASYLGTKYSQDRRLPKQNRENLKGQESGAANVDLPPLLRKRNLVLARKKNLVWPRPRT